MITEEVPPLTAEEFRKVAVPGVAFTHVSSRGYVRFVVTGKVTDDGRVPVEWVTKEGKYYEASLLGVALVPTDRARARRKYKRLFTDEAPEFRGLLTPGVLVLHAAASSYYMMAVCEAPAPGDDTVLVEWFTMYGEYQRRRVHLTALRAVEVPLDEPEAVKE